jgi:hypothetical protein
MPEAAPILAATSASRRALAHLRDVQDEHDAIRRAHYAGVSVGALASDHALWEATGAAIASLARLISGQCAASAFADCHPDMAAVTARLSESIDDLIDEPAWSVIDAAARLAAVEAP